MGLEAGIRSHILFSFFHTDFRRGLAADRLWFEAGKEDRCSVSPAGASSAQLQRAGKQETELQRLSLLSSTSAANASLRFSQEYNYISKDATKVRAEAGASKAETVRNLLRLSAAPRLVQSLKMRPSSDFFLSSLSVPVAPCSTAI